MNRSVGVHLSAADLSRPAKDLPLSTLSGLGQHLHQHLGLGNWEMLAEELGYQTDHIKGFATMAILRKEVTPGEIMLRDWRERGPGRTVFVLRQALEKLGRLDCIEYLQKEIYDKLLCVDLNISVMSQSGEITLLSVKTRAETCLLESLENVLEGSFENYSFLDQGVHWQMFAKEFKGCQLNLKQLSNCNSSPFRNQSQGGNFQSRLRSTEPVSSSCALNNLNWETNCDGMDLSNQRSAQHQMHPVVCSSLNFSGQNGQTCTWNNIKNPDPQNTTASSPQNRRSSLLNLPVQEGNVSSMSDIEPPLLTTQVKQPVTGTTEVTMLSTSNTDSSTTLSSSDNEWIHEKFFSENKMDGCTTRGKALLTELSQPRVTSASRHVQFDTSLTEVKQIDDNFCGADSTTDTELHSEIEFTDETVSNNSSSLEENDFGLQINVMDVSPTHSNWNQMKASGDPPNSKITRPGFFKEAFAPQRSAGNGYPYTSLQLSRSCPADIEYAQSCALETSAEQRDEEDGFDMPVIAELFTVTPDQERKVSFETFGQSDTCTPSDNPDNLPEKGQGFSSEFLEQSRRFCYQTEQMFSPEQEVCLETPVMRRKPFSDDSRLRCSTRSAAQSWTSGQGLPDSPGDVEGPSHTPQVPPRWPHPYKVVQGGKTSRPLLDQCLADDNLFLHYKSLLHAYHGWCPRETEYTVGKTFSSVINMDGYYMIWYMRSKRKLVLSVSHRGSLCHYRIRTKILNNKLHYYIFSNQMHQNVIHLLQGCKKNGLPSLAETECIRRRSGSLDSSARHKAPKFANIFLICPMCVDYGPRTATSV